MLITIIWVGPYRAIIFGIGLADTIITRIALGIAILMGTDAVAATAALAADIPQGEASAVSAAVDVLQGVVVLLVADMAASAAVGAHLGAVVLQEEVVVLQEEVAVLQAVADTVVAAADADECEDTAGLQLFGDLGGKKNVY
jgi:hypothetical protein